MRIIKTVNSSIYIDKAFRDYLVNIFSTYNKQIPNDKNIFFLKNTTIPKIITDYTGTNISRVIKKEKAQYCIVRYTPLSNYPIYYDAANNCITEVDTGDVVYSTTSLWPEDLQTLEQILDFHTRGQVVEYVNQDILNESLNNGFVIDKENYTTLKSLIDSNVPENLQIAASMVINSDLSKNIDWLLYLYHDRSQHLTNYDNKNIVKQYFNAKNLNFTGLCINTIDNVIAVVKDQDVIDCIVQKMKAEFAKNIETYLAGNLNTRKFELLNFELKLK